MNWDTKTLVMALMAAVLFAPGCKKDDDDDDGPVLEPVVLECDYFQEDRVLEDDPDRPVDYIVTCVAAVTADIVIKEGVVIEFEDDAGLKQNGDGTLTVEGTAAKKVVFTGVNKIKGAWRGIFFYSQNVLNSLDHAVVSYAGGNSFNSNDDLGNVICYTCKVSISNTEINNGKAHGFNAVYSSSEIRDFSNNIITDNDEYPVYSRTDYGHMYDGSNDYVGNGDDYIYLDGGQGLGGDRVFEKTNVPYLIDGNLRVLNDESLTIEAGAELRFTDDGEIDVGGGGYLSVEGTASDKVLLSGEVEQPGSWLGIINNSSDQRNVINYAEIAYAGGGAHNSNGDLGTIVVWADAYQTITNSILRDNAVDADCAINATYSDETLVLSNNTFINITNEECQ